MKETDNGYAEWLELRRDVEEIQSDRRLATFVGGPVVVLLAIAVIALGQRNDEIRAKIEKLEAATKEAARPTYPACPRPGCLSGHSPDAGFHIFEPGTATVFERDSYHRTEARQVVVNQDATVEFSSKEASTIVSLEGEKINVRRINH